MCPVSGGAGPAPLRPMLFLHARPRPTQIQRTGRAWPWADCARVLLLLPLSGALCGQSPLLPSCLLTPHAWFKLWNFFLNGCSARWQREAGPTGVQYLVEPHPELPGRWTCWQRRLPCSVALVTAGPGRAAGCVDQALRLGAASLEPAHSSH